MPIQSRQAIRMILFVATPLLLQLFTDVGDTAGGSMTISVIAVAGILFAVLTMAYTGILLGMSKGIPFWRSGVVPVVFVISVMVT